jgi:hypothetical protein
MSVRRGNVRGMRAALGFRPHTGWACAVVLGGAVRSPVVLLRRRVELSDPGLPWQPYHAAAQLRPDAAADLVGQACAAAADAAHSAVDALAAEVRAGGHELSGVGVPVGRTAVPDSLATVLASHPLMHAAEGELFRSVLADAAARHGLPAVRMTARDLPVEVCAELGCTDVELRRRLTDLGRPVGRPWRQDEKEASLAAWVVLAAPAEAPAAGQGR